MAARYLGGHSCAWGGLLLDVPPVLHRAFHQRPPVAGTVCPGLRLGGAVRPALEPEERAELDGQLTEEIAAFNTQIAAIPEAAAAGLTDYAAFLSFREDYLNGVKEAGGEADMDVEALLYRVYGGTNWYTIEELEQSMEAYDVQNESPVLQIFGLSISGLSGTYDSARDGAGGF